MDEYLFIAMAKLGADRLAEERAARVQGVRIEIPSADELSLLKPVPTRSSVHSRASARVQEVRS
jgi:hypothetical protein